MLTGVITPTHRASYAPDGDAKTPGEAVESDDADTPGKTLEGVVSGNAEIPGETVESDDAFRRHSFSFATCCTMFMICCLVFQSALEVDARYSVSSPSFWEDKCGFGPDFVP